MTFDQVDRLARDANPIPDPADFEATIGSAPIGPRCDKVAAEPTRPVHRGRTLPKWRQPPALRFAGGLALVLVWMGAMLVLDPGQPPQSELRASGSSDIDVVYTESGCSSTAEGLPPGSATFTVRNDTAAVSNFEVARLTTDYPAVVVMLRELSMMGWESFGGVEGFIEVVGDRIQLDPGESGRLAARLTPGTYVVLCIDLNDPVDQDMIRFRASGPITVTE